MKTKLSLERLEDRKVLSAYTIEILDRQNLVSQQVESQMRSAATFTMQNLDRFISWKGTLDLRIDVCPPLSSYDGITPAIMSVTPQGRNATIQEMVTGIDPYPNDPDIGMVVHLGNDGTVKVYGLKAYFDPQPVTYKPADVPAGHFDFIGVLTHEVAHGLCFQFGTTDFSRHVTTVGGYKYFTGPETVKLLGRPLPMSTFGGTHYGNHLLPDNPIKAGLMYQWGNYFGNRLDIGKLDLAILKDVGLTIKSTAGLPLVDTMDRDAPRNIISQSVVNENVSIGTTVGTVTTSQGSTGYSFQLVGNQYDNRHFRIVGNRLVTNTLVDFETKSSYTILVRNTDTKGVWTDTFMQIGVRDVKELPSLRVPPSFIMNNGSASLGSVSLGGDAGLPVSLFFYARTGTITSRIIDPQVRVQSLTNSGGGTTMVLVGTIQAINRNLGNLSYRGNDATVTVALTACLDGVCANYGQQDVRITRPLVPPIIPKPIPGRIVVARV